jgi:hypothetical protein
MHYADDELLADLHRLADDLGRPPTLTDVREHGEYAAMTYYSRFGSWRNALEEAGFQPREPHTAISRTALIEELQRLADECTAQDGAPAPPSAADMNEQGKYWASTYRRHFGSWNAAVEAAGFDPPHTSVTEADLLSELQRLADDLGTPPTYAEMEDRGAHGADTYVRRFGSWNRALEVAGFTPRSRSEVSDEELLAELERLADDLGERPSARQMDTHGAYASATYQRHFGSWSAALEYAFEE